LIHFSANRKELERMGETGHGYVMRHFDRDRLAEDYLELLQM